MEIRTNNNTLIGSAFDAMRQPLGTFEMREFIRKYGNGWWRDGVHGHLYEDQRRDVLPVTATDDVSCIDSLDILLMLRLVIQSWKDVFVAVLARRSQTWCRELIDTRNAWAHSTGGGFSDDDTARALAKAFADALTEKAAAAVTPSFKAFVKALTDKGLKVVIATRANLDVLKPALEGLDPELVQPYQEVSMTYGNGKWDAWTRALNANGLINVLTVGVTGSGHGVKAVLVACRDSNQIEIYSRDQKTGLLKDTGKRIDTPKPVFVQVQ